MEAAKFVHREKNPQTRLKDSAQSDDKKIIAAT